MAFFQKVRFIFDISNLSPEHFLFYMEYKAVSRFHSQGTDLALFLELSIIDRTFWKKNPLKLRGYFQYGSHFQKNARNPYPNFFLYFEIWRNVISFILNMLKIWQTVILFIFLKIRWRWNQIENALWDFIAFTSHVFQLSFVLFKNCEFLAAYGNIYFYFKCVILQMLFNIIAFNLQMLIRTVLWIHNCFVIILLCL